MAIPNQTISDEAKAIGYRSGIREITYLAQRIIDLERKVAELEKAQQPPHMRKAERR